MKKSQQLLLFFLYFRSILKICLASFKFISLHKLYRIRDNSVCAVLRTQTGRSKVGWSGAVLRRFRTGSGTKKPAIPWVPEGLLPVVKRLESEARHLFISNRVVRSIVSYQQNLQINWKYFRILLYSTKYLNDISNAILISRNRFITFAFLQNVTPSCVVMGTDVSEEPTAVTFRVEEKCMEPAGTWERSVPKHHTAVRSPQKQMLKDIRNLRM